MSHDASAAPVLTRFKRGLSSLLSGSGHKKGNVKTEMLNGFPQVSFVS